MTAEEYLKRGIVKFNHLRYESAIKDFDKARDLKPGYADAYYYRGLVKNSLSDFEGAIMDFDKAIELAPKNPLYYFSRGQVKERLRQLSSAIYDYDMAKKLQVKEDVPTVKRYAIGLSFSNDSFNSVRPIIELLYHRFTHERVLIHEDSFQDPLQSSWKQVELIVVFLNRSYLNNKLCRKELDIIQSLTKDDSSSVLYLTNGIGIEDERISSLKSFIPISTKKNEEIAELIINSYFHNNPLRVERVDLVHPGNNVPPCFTVDEHAEAFVSIMDSISSQLPFNSSTQSTNISLLGIFAPWGRGKTFFFNRVKECLNKRPKEAIHYDIVEFNAWKYQSIPAIWASLFETILFQQKWWNRLWFSIKRNIWPILRGLLICLAIPGTFKLLSTLYNPTNPSEPSAFAKWINEGHIVRWTGVYSVAFFIISFLAEHFSSIKTIINHKPKKWFSEQLGVQADVEKELSKLLTTLIRNKSVNRHKVLLYIEDVDRCDSDKMLSIIESLRTVLEQPEIRKRMIVVMSLDSKRLWHAIEVKYKSIYSGNDLRDTLVDHFDKLFIASLSLPSLDLDDEQQFLHALSRPLSNEPQASLPLVTAAHNLVADEAQDSKQETEHVTSLNNDTNTSANSVNNDEIIQLLFYSLSLFNHPFTPRQICCMYYRTLLAINLLSDKRKDGGIDHVFTNQIIVRSYLHEEDDEYKQYYQKTPYERILSMVIPYPFVDS